MIKSYFGVALGSAVGGVARLALSAGISRRWGTAFPWGTLAVNLIGCFLMGLFFSWAESRFRLTPEARLFLMAGFCGGFTTFSAFTLEGIGLLREQKLALFFAYIAASVLLGLLATYAGMKLTR